MAETIDGATVAVLADLGANRAPFVLDRDQLNATASVLTPLGSGLADLTALVLTLECTWGANDWQGPLTLAEAGGCTFDLFDPSRQYDPANTALADPPGPGRVVQITMDGVLVQRTITDLIGHDTAEGVTTVQGVDALAEASRVGVSLFIGQGTTDAQAQYAANSCGWGARLVLEGGFASTRKGEAFTGNLLEWLQRMQQAELGQVFATGDGTITFRARDALPATATAAFMVGEPPGIPTTELSSAIDRRVVNAVYINPVDEASPVLVYRDAVAIGLAGGEVSAEVDAADLLLI